MKTSSNHLTQAFLVVIFILAANYLQGQTLKLNPKTFNMTLFGTTNVHNFDSKVTIASGEIVINSEKKVQSFSIEMPVKGIKSKEKLMDTKTYEAFDAEKYPKISFKSTEINSVKVDGNNVSVSVTGNMSMAGVTRKVTLTSAGKLLKPGVYEFSGTIPVKMTDYKMKPPTALVVMKVGDDVKLKYTVTFEGPAIN